jgi:hypothetical protein
MFRSRRRLGAGKGKSQLLSILPANSASNPEKEDGSGQSKGLLGISLEKGAVIFS